MLNVKDFDEIVDLLIEGAYNEDCHHASYISDVEDIMSTLAIINFITDAIPDFIQLDCGDSETEYSISIDFEDDMLTYSISPAKDKETGKFYSDYGLCLVDECVSSVFEKEYKEDRFSEDYQSPIRICWSEELQDDEDDDCEKCTYNCDALCCKKNNDVEEKSKIDTDDEGRVCGFTKSWNDGDSFFTYSFHSSNEEDVLDVMKRIQKLDH